MHLAGNQAHTTTHTVQANYGRTPYGWAPHASVTAVHGHHQYRWTLEAARKLPVAQNDANAATDINTDDSRNAPINTTSIPQQPHCRKQRLCHGRYKYMRPREAGGATGPPAATTPSRENPCRRRVKAVDQGSWSGQGDERRRSGDGVTSRHKGGRRTVARSKECSGEDPSNYTQQFRDLSIYVYLDEHHCEDGWRWAEVGGDGRDAH